jgi:hypothetical protein
MGKTAQAVCGLPLIGAGDQPKDRTENNKALTTHQFNGLESLGTPTA